MKKPILQTKFETNEAILFAFIAFCTGHFVIGGIAVALTIASYSMDCKKASLLAEIEAIEARQNAPNGGLQLP